MSLDNLGPIIANTTYIPTYTTKTYNIVYYLPTDAETTCIENTTPTNKSTSSARHYIYDYGTTIKNNPDNPMDITCTHTTKTFGGWTNVEGGTYSPQLIASSDTFLYPVFVDKIPIRVYLYDILLGQILVDNNDYLKYENDELQSMIENAIAKDNITDNFKLENTTTPFTLYTDVSCTTRFTSQNITESIKLYIKGDPYVTFKVETPNAKIINESSSEVKIPLSNLSNGTKKTPIATTNETHMQFTYWKLISENKGDAKYPLTLGGDSSQLAGYSRTYPAIYLAEFTKKVYTVTFKDEEGKCSPKDVVLSVNAESIVTKADYPNFKSLTCNKDGYTWDGWTKESFNVNRGSYCSIINLILYLCIIIVIVWIIKYFTDGRNQYQFSSSVLRNSVLL